jgi:hypothetical protein
MMSVTATARYHDDANTYFSVYARIHQPDCSWGVPHPWSHLFAAAVRCDWPIAVHGPMIFVKREGGTPGAHGMHGLQPHPGHLGNFNSNDVAHVKQYCAPKLRIRG